MIPRWPLVAVLSILLFPHATAFQSESVRVSAGPDGAAQIALASGKKLTVPKERGQVGISEPQAATDGRTVGWLVDYDDGVGYPVPGTLIVWRAGKIIGRFRTDQTFYSWAFVAGGKQVAYHVGPLHGEQASHCELHDAESRRQLAAWDGDLDSDAKRPDWTQGLNH